MPLRRHPRPLVPLPAPGLRDKGDNGGYRRHRGGEGGDQRGGDQSAVRGVAGEPDSGGGGRAAAERDSEGEEGEAGGGQHVHADGPVAGQDGGRRRCAQRLQVRLRRCRHHRRRHLWAREPGEFHDGPPARGSDAAGAHHEREGCLRALGAASPPLPAHEGALQPGHGLRGPDEEAGPQGGLPGPRGPPPPRPLQVHGQPRLRLRRHALPRHGHRGARQSPHAPPPEHDPVRPHGREPRLLRDPHVVLRQQHQQRAEPRGAAAGWDIPGPHADVGGVQRHAGAAVESVRKGPRPRAAAGVKAGPRCPPLQGLTSGTSV